MENIIEIYKAYAKDVYGLSYYYLKNTNDCDDVTMEAFEALMKKMKQEDIKNPRAWLLETAKRMSLHRIRMRIRQRNMEKELGQDPIFMEKDQDEHLFEKKVDTLLSAIDKLKQGQRDAVKLFYLANKSYAEISTRLNVEVKKVKSDIQNGKRNLFNILEEKFNRIDQTQ